jgi:hypothetical protein
MKRDVSTEHWIESNRMQDERLVRWWGTSSTSAVADRVVRVQRFTKYGRMRWEAQLGHYYPHNGAQAWSQAVVYMYPRRGQAVAKGVELVLKGYATKVIE